MILAQSVIFLLIYLTSSLLESSSYFFVAIDALPRCWCELSLIIIIIMVLQWFEREREKRIKRASDEKKENKNKALFLIFWVNILLRMKPNFNCLLYTLCVYVSVLIFMSSFDCLMCWLFVHISTSSQFWPIQKFNRTEEERSRIAQSGLEIRSLIPFTCNLHGWLWWFEEENFHLYLAW